MNKPYQPSNGTEGMMFFDEFCDKCVKERRCKIIGRTMLYDPGDTKYPKQWVYDDNGYPTCTSFRGEPYQRRDNRYPSRDPNQLSIFA